MTIPTSVLNKRHNAICYHRVREYQAAVIFCFGWIPGEFKPDDFFTNTTMPGSKRHNLAESIIFNIVSPIGGIDKA